MQSPRIAVSVLTPLLVWLAATGPAQPQRYEIRSLDAPPGYTEFYPTGINNTGEIVGTAVDSSTSDACAVVWRNGTPIELAVPGGLRSRAAVAINASGVIVGYERDQLGNAHAMLWKADVGRRLDRFEIGFSNGIGINKSGQVAITAYASGAGGAPDSYLSEYGALAPLGAFQATALNASGQVIGYRATPLPDLQGVVWQSGTNHDLGDRDTWLLPLAINDTGLIVGSTWTSLGVEHAATWQDGSLHDLNDAVDPNSGWVLWRASSTNNAGQIVGYGALDGEPSAFLLTPSGP